MVDKEDRHTTRVCPNCGNDRLLLFTTLNIKTCTDCDTDIPWYLEPNQSSLHETAHAN